MAAERPLLLEVGGGAYVPLARDHRDDYGTGAAFSFGVTSRITPHGAWLLLDVGVTRNRGRELAPDPTFETEDATLWLVPIRIGVRRDVVPPTYAGFPRLTLGIAFQTIVARGSVPWVETRTSASVGLSVEVRADVIGNDRWRLWVRQGMALGSSVRIAPELRELDPSGAQVQVGLAYTVH